MLILELAKKLFCLEKPKYILIFWSQITVSHKKNSLLLFAGSSHKTRFLQWKYSEKPILYTVWTDKLKYCANYKHEWRCIASHVSTHFFCEYIVCCDSFDFQQTIFMFVDLP